MESLGIPPSIETYSTPIPGDASKSARLLLRAILTTLAALTLSTSREPDKASPTPGERP
jgi:hypothetical protein